MAESEAVDDFSKRMRPMTANEVAAIRRNKLSQNKLIRETRHIRLRNELDEKEIIKRQFELECSVNDISKSQNEMYNSYIFCLISY